MISIQNKNALVTGSSRGIGQQIAMGLAKLGCNIVLHGRREENCTETLQLLTKYPVKTYVVSGDLAREKEVNDLIQQVRNLNIHIDILYNNAAIMPAYHKDYWRFSRKDWLDTYTVNVIAMYELCAAFIPPMIENGFGRVINLSSGIKHEPELAPYGVSKAAVDKLSDDIAPKLKNTGVRINFLDPGWLQTDMGGTEADYPVEAVLPGALAPALVDDDGTNGQFFSAINQKLNI